MTSQCGSPISSRGKNSRRTTITICIAHNSDDPIIPESVVCGSCNLLSFTKDLKRPHIQCGKCQNFFHIGCQDITTFKFIDLTAYDSVVWFCMTCEDTLLQQKLSRQFNLLRNQWMESLEPIKSSVAVNTSKIRDHEQAITTCLKKIDDLEHQLVANNKLLTDLQSLSSDVNNNSAAIVNVNKRLDESKKLSDTKLNDKIERFDKLSRANNLTLAGVPCKPGEDLSKFIISLGKFIGIQLTAQDFDVFRVTSSNSNSPPIIIIRFLSVKCKSSFFGLYLDKLKSQIYISLASIGYSESTARVYLNHHLSETTNHIFYKARCLRRDRKISQVLVSFGTVYIRLNGESSPKIKVMSLEQLSAAVPARSDSGEVKKQVAPMTKKTRPGLRTKSQPKSSK